MDMVRQEKAGSRATNNMDLEFANKIVTDASFEVQCCRTLCMTRISELKSDL